jgi:hypothetical protein
MPGDGDKREAIRLMVAGAFGLIDLVERNLRIITASEHRVSWQQPREGL